MNWPTHSDYQDAMQNPAVCFQEPELKTGTAATDMLGLPRVMSGNFASVYELQCNGARWAVRCFVRQVPGQQGRYSRLSQHLNSLTMPYLVKFEYMLKGILVRGEWYPIVKMQWVDGVPLNTFIEDHINEPETLLKLAEDWRNMMKSLAQFKLAHGDLQHGNVMVTPNNELRLVDYDGMFAPIFGRGRAPELGHINFQHPRRTAEFYQEDLDNFSALVIYTSLRAIASEPELFHKHYTVDNLILTSNDYKNPLNSPVFSKLKQSKDLAVQQLAKLLEKCCVAPVECVPDFNAVMAALDAGSSLESMQLKSAAAAAPRVPHESSVALPAIDATGKPKSRPITGGTPAAPGATRSAYDNVPTAKSSQTSSFKTPQHHAPARPTHAPVVPQAAPEDSSTPRWVWGLVGAVVIAIIAPIGFFMKFGPAANTQSQAVAPQKSSPRPKTAPSSAVSAETETPTPAPAPQPTTQKTDRIKVTLLGTLRGHNGSVDAVAFSRDGELLATAGADKSVRMWNVQSGEPRKTLTGAADSLLSLTFAPDNKTLAGVCADNTVLFWDYNSGQPRQTVTSEKNNLFPLALSTDAALLATGGSDRKTVRLIDPISGQTKKVLANHTSWIRSVSFSADNKFAAVQCHDDSINIWDLATGQLLRSISSPGNTVMSAAFSHDGRFLAAGGENRDVKVWDLQTGGLHQTFSDHTGDIKSCAFSPDRRWLASGSDDKTIKVWEVFTGQLKQTLTSHEGAVNIVAFSNDGTMMVSGSADQSVKLWQLNF